MKNWYPFILLVLLAACSGEKQEVVVTTPSPTPNMLLSDILEVDYSVPMDTSRSDTWQKNFDAPAFLSGLRKNVHEGKIPVYSPFYNDTAGALITLPYLEMDLGKYKDHQTFEWGSYATYRLGFTETWSFDTVTSGFTKQVRWWYPLFYSRNDSSDHPLFKVFNGAASELLAADMIFEIRFDDHASGFRYLNSARFYDWMTRSAISGKIAVYAPDDTVHVLKSEVIRERLGEGMVKVAQEGPDGTIEYTDKKQPYDLSELSGIIFIEDWFYDKSTGAFSKKVTGIAPVRHYEDESGKELKSIPFVFYTGKKKVNIL